MCKLLDTLCHRLETIRRDHDGCQSPWEEWIDDPLGLTPWQIWTLLGLVRHRKRQQFVADTINYRLNADQHAIAAVGAMGPPAIPQQGLVPGLPVWEYYFHGCGCRLTHRMTGEVIDVDFLDSSADWFDDFFYFRYLKSW